MRNVHYHYAISSFDRRFIVKCTNGFNTVSIDEFDDPDNFLKSVLIFPSVNDAEDFIFRNNLLNVDVTFRPELL